MFFQRSIDCPFLYKYFFIFKEIYNFNVDYFKMNTLKKSNS